MALELIANEDWEIEITPLGPQTPVGSHALVSWTETKSPSTKIDDKSILVDKISWSVGVGLCSHPSLSVHSGSTAVIDIMPQATKCKDDNKIVMRENDEGTCFCTFSNPGSYSASCTFKLKKAGQTSVKGE